MVHVGRLKDAPPPPPPSPLYVAVFRNDFAFSGKPLIFSTRRAGIFQAEALLEAFDVTNNGRQFGRHLGFYHELENYKFRVTHISGLNIVKCVERSKLELSFFWGGGGG